MHVGEDGIGLWCLLQRLGFHNPFEPVTHAIEDVTHGSLAGQVVLGVALLGKHLLPQFRGREVGVAAFRFEFWVSLGVRLDEGTDVLCPLRIFLFPARATTSGKVLHTADALLQFMQALGDGVASPAEAAFSRSGIAVTQFKSNFS
jgi:hypothetical protein